MCELYKTARSALQKHGLVDGVSYKPVLCCDLMSSLLFFRGHVGCGLYNNYETKKLK